MVKGALRAKGLQSGASLQQEGGGGRVLGRVFARREGGVKRGGVGWGGVESDGV